MNDTLVNKATAMGLQALDFVGKTTAELVELLRNEIPEILQQWLVFNMWESVILMIAGLILITVVLVVFIKDKLSDWDYVHGSGGTIVIFYIFGSLIGILLFIFRLIDFIKIIVAPKLWIIENIQNLVGGK